MANYCSFEMHIKGKKENIETLVDWLSASYHYTDEEATCTVEKDGKTVPCEHHIGYMVFEAYAKDMFEDEDTPVWVYGECAWSVMSCMFDLGYGCYMSDLRDRKNSLSISIDEASRILELEIEIFSSEPGIGFAEHYYIKNGEIVVNSETDYIELRTEDEEAEFTEEEKESIEEFGLDSVIRCDFYNADECCWYWEYV